VRDQVEQYPMPERYDLLDICHIGFPFSTDEVHA
jgi:hypothetical protein